MKVFMTSLKGYMWWYANLQTGGISISKSLNAQHRTPISHTTLQAIVTLSGHIIQGGRNRSGKGADDDRGWGCDVNIAG